MSEKEKIYNEASLAGVSFAIIATVLAKGAGFIREVLVAKVFGTTNSSDALIVALNVPTIMVSGFALALSTIYIPTYYKIQKQHPFDYQKIIGKLNFNLILLLFIFGASIITFVEIMPIKIVKLFAPGFDFKTMSLCADLLKITIIATLFILFSSLFKAHGQMQNKYAFLTLAGSIINILLILSLLFTKKNLLIELSYLSTFGYFIYMIILFFSISKKGSFFILKSLDIKNKYLKKMCVCFFPVFLSNIITELNQIVDKNFASTLSAGTISALNYSSKMVNFITSIFGTAISSVLFVKLSKLSINGNNKNLSEQITKLNSYLLTIVLPIFWITIMLSKYIVNIIYGHGNFDLYSVQITSECLSYYACGIVFFNLKAIWIRCYNASLDTKTPAINSSVAVILNIILNFLLIGTLKHKGLALATVISSFFTDILLIMNYRKINTSFNIGIFVNEILRPLLASLVFFINFFFIKYIISNTLWISMIQIILVSIFSFIVYIFLLIIIKSEVGIYIKNILFRIERRFT